MANITHGGFAFSLELILRFLPLIEVFLCIIGNAELIGRESVCPSEEAAFH